MCSHADVERIIPIDREAAMDDEPKDEQIFFFDVTIKYLCYRNVYFISFQMHLSSCHSMVKVKGYDHFSEWWSR